jgi:hypothetical protein
MKFKELLEKIKGPAGYFIYNKEISEENKLQIHGPFSSSTKAWESLFNMNNPTNFVIGKFSNADYPIEEESFVRFLEDDELLDEETEIDEATSQETRIRGGKRVALKKYSGNDGNAEDRNYRVVNGKKQKKSNARKEHDRKKNSASDRWKNMDSSERREISKNIKKSMKKADRLHGKDNDKSNAEREAERIINTALLIKQKRKRING